jgi:peptide/nickel transport system permease protein
MRLTRAQVLEVMRQDYIRTASSKGLRERTVIVRHALKNALIPVTTLIALQIPIIIGGTVVLETIFSVPGMGAYLVTAATGSDYTVIQAVNLLVAVVVLTSNLVTDIIYAYLDPRIRYS